LVSEKSLNSCHKIGSGKIILGKSLFENKPLMTFEKGSIDIRIVVRYVV